MIKRNLAGLMAAAFLTVSNAHATTLLVEEPCRESTIRRIDWKLAELNKDPVYQVYNTEFAAELTALRASIPEGPIGTEDEWRQWMKAAVRMVKLYTMTPEDYKCDVVGDEACIAARDARMQEEREQMRTMVERMGEIQQKVGFK